MVIHLSNSKMLYIVYSTLPIMVLLSILALVGSSNLAHAADFNANLTIKPSMTLTIPTSTISMNLDPGSKTYDERDFLVSVATNNPTGYKLYISTVDDTTSLINDDDNTKTIPTLDSTYSIDSFPANYWGYRTSLGTVSSGDYKGFTSGDIISESNVPTNTITTAVGLASKIDYMKPSGTYELALNFEAVAPVVELASMQDYNNATCAAEASGAAVPIVDERDGNEYNVRYIDDNCWMVDNLRYIGDTGSTSGSMVMKAATSNISTDRTISYTDLTQGNNYNYARIHVATDDQVPSGASYTATDMGVWYNYVATSAGYVTGTQNQTVQADESICPNGWRLPTNSEYLSMASYYSIFNIITGGDYNTGQRLDTGHGRWWTATPAGTKDRYHAYSDGGKLNTGNTSQYYGFYIRCIRSS